MKKDLLLRVECPTVDTKLFRTVVLTAMWHEAVDTVFDLIPIRLRGVRLTWVMVNDGVRWILIRTEVLRV